MDDICRSIFHMGTNMKISHGTRFAKEYTAPTNYSSFVYVPVFVPVRTPSGIDLHLF